VSDEEALQRAMTEAVAKILQGPSKLGRGDVRCIAQEATDHSMLRLDPAGAAVATQRPGRNVALTPIQGPPTTDACGADTEPRRRGPMAGALGDRKQDTGSKIDGQGSRHGSRPPRRPPS